MLIKPPADIPSSEIADEKVWVGRRQFVRAATAAMLTAAAACQSKSSAEAAPTPAAVPPAEPLGGPAAEPQAAGARDPFAGPFKKSQYSTTEKPNTWEQITTYNNFYEFGTDKDSPARYAKTLKPSPWSVIVAGECAKPATYAIEDIFKGQTFEDRIYRHRCVEAWSLVIPWLGFPLADFIKRCEPTSKAKYVEFTSLADVTQMPGLRYQSLRWPYTEGLRMDEAMNPLTLLAVGLYGKRLPNQDGAPIRLVTPWKYGFKGAKSIVKIRFTETQPMTSWSIAAPREYGFYANVNPMVSHPRWSQAREIRLPGLFMNHPTQMFNGYGAQVAGMYTNLDLTANF